MLLVLIFFNPVSLCSLCAQNTGCVGVALMYISIYYYLSGKTLWVNWIERALVIGLSLYVDHNAWILHLGILATDCSYGQIFASGFTFFVILLSAFPVQEQIQNLWNTLTLKDHSENVGVYWYLSIEIFKEHVNFFIYAFLVYQFIILLHIKQISDRVSKVIQMTGKNVDRRMFRLRCVIVFLITFMKIVFNQYPLLTDLANLQFLLVCLCWRLVSKHLEGSLLIGFLFSFSCLNTVFMWITWLDRFSGNANFFYFQTCIMNLSLVIIFIQVF